MPFKKLLPAGLAVLLTSQAALAQAVLRDDFDGRDFSPAGHLFYKHNFEQDAGTVRFQSDVVRAGKQALQLSVREHCPKGDEDCSERAEVWEKPDAHVPYLQGAWYAFSVKFADPIPRDAHRYVIAQWKREITGNGHSDFSPLLAVRLDGGKLFATVETGTVPVTRGVACAPGETRVFAKEKRGQTRALVAVQAGWDVADSKLYDACTRAIRITPRGGVLPAPESGWIDFVIYSKPGPSGDGRVEIIANGQWIASVTGQIGHEGEGLGPNQYFKFGPYRAAGKGEWKLYYANFRRGPACRDVAEAGCPAL